MLNFTHYSKLGLASVYEKVMHEQRLNQQDGEALFACPDLVALGALAHHVRTRMHALKTYYVRNRHINYSNVCLTGCRFCAFKRLPDTEGAFTLSHDAIIARALDDAGYPFTELHLVGGCHPELPLSWFEQLFRRLKKERPHAVIKAFTVMEIAHFAKKEQLPIKDVLLRLQQAGVAMLTGGGAEIFDPTVRDQICPNKISGDAYLNIAGQAHALGIASNCSMLFGHIESPAQRVAHCIRLREQQDLSKGFVCFIPLAYQPLHNELAHEVNSKNTGSQVHLGQDRLRTIAISRLLLDNIPHIKAYWVMLGVKTAQSALYFGANDLDGTIVEERIGHMAGAEAGQSINRLTLEAMIRNTGFEPVNRDPFFNAASLDKTGAAL